MGQLGQVPDMLGGYGFHDEKEFAALSTKDNFDGGGHHLMEEVGRTRGARGESPSLEKLGAAMMHHAKYLQVFLRMHNHILKGDGPLSYEMRHFVAMMAASRHQCSYLFRMEAEEFLNSGGESSWLTYTGAPDKLKVLSNLNKIMAHRPWMMNKQMIQDLVRTGDKSSWCLSELVHAIVILAHIHSLSSFIYATGIEETECVQSQQQEPGVDGTIKMGEAEMSDKGDDKIIQERVQYLMDQMKSLSERERDNNWVDDPEERIKRFASVMDTDGTDSSTASRPDSPQAGASPVTPVKPPLGAGMMASANGAAGKEAGKDVAGKGARVTTGGTPARKKGADLMAKFIVDGDFFYQDFVSRGQVASSQTFRIQDCSWEDQGFSLLSRLYSETSSTLLDDKHRTAYNLTYNTLSTIRNVDTSKFRRAVWNYILCLFGIRHDDYNYGEVNQLLQRELKTFIKTACVYPERLSGKDLRNTMKELQYSEKVHVLLMVMEARMEAELLYALRAVMQHLT